MQQRDILLYVIIQRDEINLQASKRFNVLHRKLLNLLIINIALGPNKDITTFLSELQIVK